MNFHEFLVTPIAHLPPAHMLDGLDSTAAERRATPATHSIAEIAAHLTWWQEWFLARLSGTAAPMPESAARGWPEVTPGSWPDLRTQFLEGLERLAALGGDATQAVDPPIEFPPLAHYTRADALVHVATHTAHHLGQIVVLRQVLGVWPPPSGGLTW